MENNNYCRYSNIYSLAFIVVLISGMIYYYSKVIYELKLRGVSLYFPILQLYIYPLIVILT